VCGSAAYRRQKFNIRAYRRGRTVPPAFAGGIFSIPRYERGTEDVALRQTRVYPPRAGTMAYRPRGGTRAIPRNGAGSAAAPRGCLRSTTLFLFSLPEGFRHYVPPCTGKREKATKREESTRGFLLAAPLTPPKFAGLVRFGYPWLELSQHPPR
jgi:hypothetical protein